MTSFLIVSPDSKKRTTFYKEFCEKHEIDLFDRTIITRETSSKTTTQSIGIETIKQIQKKLFLKPIKSATKAVILEEAHLLTTEAQNALLKVLEEPPAATMIMLSADSKESLLPTILSRCQIVELQQEKPKLTAKEETTLKEFLANLPTMTVGEKLKKAEQLAKDKEKAAIWIGKLVLVAREEMIADIRHSGEEQSSDSRIPNYRDSGRARLARMTNYVKSLQSLYTTLKTTNANPRFAIETTLLNIP